MLLDGLRTQGLAPERSGRIGRYLDALVRSSGVSVRIAHSFRSIVNFADVAATLTECNKISYLSADTYLLEVVGVCY